jgi:hypothetical protein
MDNPHHAMRRLRRHGIFILLAAVVMPTLLIAPPAARSISAPSTSLSRFGRRRPFVVMSVAALLSVAVGMSPPNAHAAAYSVWACADGAGRLLPDGDWKEVRVNGPVHFLSSTCGDPDVIPRRALGIAVSGRGNEPSDSGGGWRVEAAPATKITGLDLWWSGGMVGNMPSFEQIPGRVEVLAPSSIFRLDGDGNRGASFGYEVTTSDTADLAYDDRNHWTFRNLSTHDLTLMAWCLSACQGVPGVGSDVFTSTVAHFEAYRMKTVVEDASPPGGTASGLQDGARITVPTSVQAAATDLGSGVREVALRVDGRVVQRVSPGGPCADVDAGNSDPLEYTLMRPCPGEQSGAFTLWPNELADGERHVVSVVAKDAAGQESVLLTARAALASPPGFFASSGFFNPDLDVGAPRSLNGANADAGPANVRLSFVVGKPKRFATRRVVRARVRPRISGRLTSALGAPISGARVWRASAVAKDSWQISGVPLTTSGTGRVSGRLPAHSPSRDVRLIYFPYSDSSENAQSPSRRLEVRASTTIRLDQVRYRNGDTVRFSGRITTRPVIRRKAVYLQVVVRGRWRTFDTTRADASGRWDLRYRFTATRHPTAYRFRAVIPNEHAFPWATGRSRAVRVVVMP